jgi:hypothetical protein
MMTDHDDLVTQALRPGHSSAVLLNDLSSNARSTVVATLAAALVRADALALADALAGEPLTTARAAAVEPQAAIDAAREALAQEHSGIAGKLADFWAKRRAGAHGSENPPPAETPETERLRAELAAVEAEGLPFLQAVKTIEEQVAGLRNAPAPDPATLAALALALVGGYRDDDSD